MIDLKARPEVGWNVLFVVSLVGVVAAAWYAFLKPTPADASTSVRKEVARINGLARQNDDKADLEEQAIRSRVWDVNLEALGPKVLDRLTSLADKRHLQLTGFRTERPTEVSGITEAPLVAVVEGAYPDVVGLIRDLETEDTKLAVNLTQIAGSDADAARVTATLGLVGFVRFTNKTTPKEKTK